MVGALRWFAARLRHFFAAPLNLPYTASSTGDAILKVYFRLAVSLATAALLTFAAPGSLRSSARSQQDEQAPKPKPQRPVEPPPRSIAMTAKDFEFDPAIIHMKVGDKVRLQVTSLDRTHGLHVSAFPDGAKANTPPGLAFIFGEDCFKLKKGESVPVDIEATEPGTYSFVCCKACDTGNKRMKGQIIVDP
jgi:heme/copper-type cytochrome/quinol oxidase subunit 2